MTDPVTIPNRPGGGDTRSIADILADFDAILDVFNNGEVESKHLKDAVQDALAITGDGVTRRDYATVATEEATTSNAWTDLATSGPSVTITVPSNMLVLVAAQVEAKISDTASYAQVGIHEATDYAIDAAQVSLSSAASRLVGARESLIAENASSYGKPHHAVTIMPATAGSRTYTLKYGRNFVTSATATFKNRKIWAMALGGF